jgi:hypothetical protein
MTILNNGMNRVRDIFNTDISKCMAGTGTTAPQITDTTLQAGDPTTLLTPTIVTTDRSLQVTHTIPSTTGSGTAYSEQQIQSNAGATSFNRVVHTALTKGDDEEFNYITVVFFERGQ